jgi:2-desacetyl-2-hydroxyethyl bacteriochlorophyllide A dehydrogenase
MGTQIVFPAPRQVTLEDTPDLPLKPSEVCVRTMFSGISAGTELTQYRGSNPYLHQRFDSLRRLFVADRPGLAYPLKGVGYEQMGEVVEVGPEVTNLQIGQKIWGSWGHRSHVVLAESIAAPRVMPEGADPRLGVFARIGAIALGPVHDAGTHLGETVAVFGMGVLGLIALQLARLSGATVIAVDGIAKRLELARQLGAEHTVDFHRANPGETIKALTQGRGADVSLELSGSYAALHEAIRATAYNSRVVVAGFLQGEGVGLRLGEEFHHNRIELVSSQTQGIGPHLSHRWDRLRQEQSIVRLAAQGRLQLLPLITHAFPFAEVEAAFKLLDQQASEAVQVILEFP